MNCDYWLDERAKLQSILDDIEAGHIVLRNGEAEYLDTLKRRMASLDEKIAQAAVGANIQRDTDTISHTHRWHHSERASG